MNLFLASTLEGSINLLIKEYKLTPQETPVAYIPTAGNCYTPPRSPSERGSFQCLIERGFPVVLCDLETEKPNQMNDKMKGAKIIVGAGGNSFYLLHHMKRSGFDQLLPRLLDDGTIYVGSSAGSCVCCPDISYVQDEDDPGKAPDLTNYRGLNLVNFEIYPHCIEELESTPEKIYLRDHEAIVVKNDKYKMVPTQ
ncbi:Type 1 glutamine amidotransferase-like domain-containing protein [Candidatus Woesebacteria bacterium]|nr:Type 1 glutamine amidotransferase-like domain-containing protein [Candidatus Woesebacteria bacterium]